MSDLLNRLNKLNYTGKKILVDTELMAETFNSVMELEALAIKHLEAAAASGQAAMRMRFALLILREWALGKCYHAGAMIAIRDWIDGGMDGPVPWPGGAFFEEWAEKQGFSNVDGFVGFRVTVQLLPDTKDNQ
jgi:hypothetical protein